MADIRCVTLGTDLLSIEICGEFDLVDEVRATRMVNVAIDSGVAAVLLDLTDCEFIDLAGVRILLRAYERASERGRRLAAAAGPAVLHTLAMTGLRERLPVFEQRLDALGALGMGQLGDLVK